MKSAVTVKPAMTSKPLESHADVVGEASPPVRKVGSDVVDALCWCPTANITPSAT